MIVEQVLIFFNVKRDKIEFLTLNLMADFLFLMPDFCSLFLEHWYSATVHILKQKNSYQTQWQKSSLMHYY